MIYMKGITNSEPIFFMEAIMKERLENSVDGIASCIDKLYELFS